MNIQLNSYRGTKACKKLSGLSYLFQFYFSKNDEKTLYQDPPRIWLQWDLHWIMNFFLFMKNSPYHISSLTSQIVFFISTYLLTILPWIGKRVNVRPCPQKQPNGTQFDQVNPKLSYLIGNYQGQLRNSPLIRHSLQDQDLIEICRTLEVQLDSLEFIS